MASVNTQLATSGLFGAITSLLVGTADKFIPDGNLKSLVAVASGMGAALLAFEIMSWYVIIRLRFTKGSLDRILPQFERIQEQLENAIDHQVALMRDQNVPQNTLRDIERETNELRRAIISTLIEINRKSLEIVRSISS